MMQIFPAGKQANKRNRRFSLVEVIAVLVLISLIMFMVLPKIGLIPGSVIKKETINSIKKAFISSRQLSQSENNSVALVLNEESMVLSIERDDDKKTSKIFRDFTSFPLNDTLTIERADPELEKLVYQFYPDGEASGPELKIMSESFNFYLKVDQLSGRAIIDEKETF